MFPESTVEKYNRLSPRGKKNFRERCKKTLDQLEYAAAQDKLDAHRAMFEGASSAARTDSPPKTKKNNKGTAVLPDSPDCGLSPNNPGRDGTRSSRRLFAYSPEPKVRKSTEPLPSAQLAAAASGGHKANKAVWRHAARVLRWQFGRDGIVP